MSTVAFQPAALDQAVPSSHNFLPGGNIKPWRRSTSQTKGSSRSSPRRSPVSESTVVDSLPEHSESPSPKSPSESESEPESACNEPPASVVALKIVLNSPLDVNKLKYHRSNYYPSDPTKSSFKHLKPLQLDFERETPLANWKEIRGGRPYFYDSNRALLTRTNLFDEDSLVHIETAANMLVERRDAVRELIPADTEIVMCKTWDFDAEVDVIGYYLVSVSTQRIFWLPPQDGEDPIPVELLTEGIRYVASLPHLGLSNGFQFWTHLELFPGHRPLSSAVVDELIHTFNAGLCDAITSVNSTFPYDAETITRLAKTFESVTPDTVNPYGSFIAGRLLARVYYEKYLNFWGEPGARLTRSEGALGDSEEKTLNLFFLKLVSPLFFFMPILYVQELQDLYVDESVHYYPWRMFIEGLKKDWENSITPTTVLIATNIGFLSINSIDGNGGPNKSVAQILSYVSTILAAFIYIVCQILQRHHRHHVHGQAPQALAYIQSRSLPMLAITFSIPTALFLWSMITFLAAMMAVFFDHTALATRIALGVLLLLLLLVLVLLLYLESEGTIRSTFNSFSLIRRLWWNTSEWCCAHWPSFGKRTRASDTPSTNGEQNSEVPSTPSDTSSMRKKSQIRRWLSQSRQSASDIPV